tara:strand:- start:151 stop:252 length:102 start_codon:yes stop_codon:yes gene_type:complete
MERLSRNWFQGSKEEQERNRREEQERGARERSE